jgi:hypothetical protein
MRNRVIGAAVAALCLSLSLCSPARAQAPKLAPGTGLDHDISGVWGEFTGGAHPPQGLVTRSQPPVMTPEGQARFDDNTSQLKQGLPVTKSPAFQCLPAGVLQGYGPGTYAVEFVQTPQRIFMILEFAHQWREIWMDGHPIPKDSDPLWMGYAVGHWDGNDLVVDIGDFNDLTWLDSGGHGHSDQLKITERFHRDGDALVESATIDDPKFYKQPWTVSRAFQRHADWQIGESFCVRDEETRFENQVVNPAANPPGAK